MELENVPAWLEIPLTYYSTLGKDLRLELYQLIAKDKVNEKMYKLVTTILQLLQLSNIMLDDMTHEVEIRSGKKAIHLEHTPCKVGLWTLGLSHYIYKIISENVGPDELAFKYIQLYNELGTRSAEFDANDVQVQNVEELQKKLEQNNRKTIKDYRDILKRTTACYVASFPVALFAMEQTDDVQKVLRLLEDDDLLEFGFLLQAETEFIDFHTETNYDVEAEKWTVLIDLLCKAMMAKGDKFVYPKSKEETIILLEKYKIYDEYLKRREAGIQSLKYELMSMKMSQLKGSGPPCVFEAKIQVLEYCLEYFDMLKYKNVKNGIGGGVDDEEKLTEPLRKELSKSNDQPFTVMVANTANEDDNDFANGIAKYLSEEENIIAEPWLASRPASILAMETSQAADKSE